MSERGQASVELVAVLPLAVVVALAAGQAVAAGAAAELAGHAAEAGAVALLQDGDPRRAARRGGARLVVGARARRRAGPPGRRAPASRRGAAGGRGAARARGGRGRGAGAVSASIAVLAGRRDAAAVGAAAGLALGRGAVVCTWTGEEGLREELRAPASAAARRLAEALDAVAAGRLVRVSLPADEAAAAAAVRRVMAASGELPVVVALGAARTRIFDVADRRGRSRRRRRAPG